jgi:hypothetical protein
MIGKKKQKQNYLTKPLFAHIEATLMFGWAS